MELANLDIGFITETWINKTTALDSMTSQAKQAGYTIISHKCTKRKGGGLMCIHVRIKCPKGETNLKKSFDGLIVKLQQASFALIYRPPYSKKNPVQMLTFLEEFPDFLIKY